MVRAKGLEPPRLSSLEPKSSASTSSATPATRRRSGLLRETLAKAKGLWNSAFIGFENIYHFCAVFSDIK